MAESPAPSEPLLSAPIPYELTGCLDEPRIEGRRASGAVSWDNSHPVNLRLSIPFFFKRYYLTLAAGKERRSSEKKCDKEKTWERSGDATHSQYMPDYDVDSDEKLDSRL